MSNKTLPLKASVNVKPARKQANPGEGSPSVLFYIFLSTALLIFIRTFKLLSPILLSLLLILLISLAVNPVISRMRAWTGGRRGATALLALGLVGVIGLSGWAFFVPMKKSVSNFAEQMPEYWKRLQKPLIKMEQQALSSEKEIKAEVTTEIAQKKAAEGEAKAESTAPTTSLSKPKPEPTPEPEPRSDSEESSDSDSDSVTSILSQMFQGLFGRFTAVAVNGAQILIVMATVFFGVIFTLMNPRPIFGAMFSLIPNRHHAQALTIMQRIGNFVPGWVGSTLLGMLTIGVLVVLLMWPIFGFTDALVLGLVAGIFAAIPFIGPILSAVPAVLLAFGEGGMTPVWVILAYLGIQALETAILILASERRLVVGF